MGLIHDYTVKSQQVKENKIVFQDNLKNSGVTLALSKAKYLGGYPDILEEKTGKITVKNVGVFFSINRTNQYFFIPVEEIQKAEFKSGEDISKNELFSRFLAYSGFKFAFKKKEREKHMYLTVHYIENKVECTLLFESSSANRLASIITKITQEHAKESKITNDTSLIEMMKEINLLKAMSVITEAEYNEKKKELLSRI